MGKRLKIDGTAKDIRLLVRGIADIQGLRVAMGNRITGNFNVKLGQEPGKEQTDAEINKVLKQLKTEYKRITDAYIIKKDTLDSLIKSNKGIISNALEYKLVESYMLLLKDEEGMVKMVEQITEQQDIWKVFLKDVKGCGAYSAAILISELDPYVARHRSSFWKYAGLDVVNGKGRSRDKDSLVDKVYLDSDGNKKTTKGISFNPFLKTKLVGVMADVFIKCHSIYTRAYYGYKHRQVELYSTIEKYEKDGTPVRKFDKGITLGHINSRAKRYMMKMFLADLWVHMRELEGLPTDNDYSVQFLGKRPHGFNYNYDLYKHDEQEELASDSDK